FQYMMIGAGAVYLVGVIDAFINLDSGTPRRRAAELSPQPEKRYDIGVSPTFDGGVAMRFSLRLD
ncbi:MAG: hypothetical protein RL189_1727, partial [Pseudomonadota bacterium]